ncbi:MULTISPECIES: amyloid fiber anchoring/assembly protein TapA [Clostridia]|uniref:amyloid fiber anchoring/assembly protein TapA n=1 Tax=Clostridia TaxID=186801 RepID=UPI001314B160|nr:amyloid fiber anchoring/assembly protein TapA [Clostridium sp. 1xD42-85]
MKRSRIRRHQNKYRYWYFGLKVFVIGYAAVYLLGYMTSSTTAYFHENVPLNGEVTIGEWQEQLPVIEETYELEFIRRQGQQITTCEGVTLKAKIKNVGSVDMTKSITYDVFYAEKGNPRKYGKSLDLKKGEGEIHPLANKETATLTATVEQPGVYVFLVKQADDDLLWSKEINVQCKEKQKSKDVGEPSESQAPSQVQPNPKTENEKREEAKDANQAKDLETKQQMDETSETQTQQTKANEKQEVIAEERKQSTLKGKPDSNNQKDGERNE